METEGGAGFLFTFGLHCPWRAPRVWEDAGLGLHLEEVYFPWGASEFSMSFESTQGTPSMFTLLNLPPPISFPRFYHFAVVTVHESTPLTWDLFILFCSVSHTGLSINVP